LQKMLLGLVYSFNPPYIRAPRVLFLELSRAMSKIREAVVAG